MKVPAAASLTAVIPRAAWFILYTNTWTISSNKSTTPPPPAAVASSPIVTVYGTWSMVNIYWSPTSGYAASITNLSIWFSELGVIARLRSSNPDTLAPVADPRISYLMVLISEPTQTLWFVVVISDILEKLGELGIITVLDKLCPPHPIDVAFITTVPDHPSAQVTRPLTESNVPAVSLFQDHVTSELEVNCVVSPSNAGQSGRVKGS